MNHKAMLELADRLEREMPRVDMALSIRRYECGSVGCIAGWWSEWNCKSIGFAPIYDSSYENQGGEHFTAMDVAQIGLGLNDNESSNLFSPCLWPGYFIAAYLSAATNEARVRVMAERIRRMVRDDIANVK